MKDANTLWVVASYDEPPLGSGMRIWGPFRSKAAAAKFGKEECGRHGIYELQTSVVSGKWVR